MLLDALLTSQGEVFEIRRGSHVSTAKGLPNREKSGGRRYIGFKPDVEVIAGDELVGMVSGNHYLVTGIERQLFNGQLFQVKAFYDQPHAPAVNTINVGSMVNSTIQQGSPGAMQQVVISQQQCESASELINAISELINQLNLPADQREKVESDVEMLNTILSAPNTKPSTLRKCFIRVKETLSHFAGVATTAVATAATQDVITRIEHFLTQGSGQ